MKSKFNQKKFNEVSQQWLAFKKMSVKYSTYVKYENTITAYLIEDFGEISLKNIDENMIITFFQKKIEEKYANSTLTCIRYVLKSILEFGQKLYGVAPINFNYIKIGKLKNKYTILSHHQKSFLDQYCFTHYEPISIAILLSMYGGLRLGEFCGLKWCDIDFQNDLLYVHRTIERLKCEDKNSKCKTKLMILEPKTDTSKRVVPLPHFIIEYLVEYYEQTGSLNTEYYIYTNSLAIPDPRNVQYHFNKVCKSYNFHINYHSLRHSYATNCMMHEIDIKSLSEILGHSSVSTTLNLYVHSTIEFKKTQISKLEKPEFIVEF